MQHGAFAPILCLILLARLFRVKKPLIAYREGTMRKASICVVVTALFVLGISQIVGAQEARKGRNLCAPDIAKYCKDVKQGGGNIAACLKEHEADLSPACKDYIAGLREKGREFAQHCGADVAQLCMKVQPGDGRIIECLKEHQSELSDSCKTYFSQAR
jgi:hypothetical protein